jgi:hypothetical protein
MQIRNQLTHAKSVPIVSIASVQNALTAIVESLEALYQAIYGRSFPPYSQGLQSKFTF